MKRIVLALCMVALLAGCQLGKGVEAGAHLYKGLTVSNEELIEVSREMRAKGDAENTIAPAKNKYAVRLARLTQKLATEDGLDLNFKVYLTSDINANATPDGSIRVYSGLMDMMSDGELMFIIGHEIGHVKNGDSLDKLRTAYLASAARKGASATGGVAAALSESVLGNLLEAVINAQFSQSQEYDADAYGLNFVRKYKIDPKAAVSALRKIDKLGESGGFLASHPNSAERANKLQGMINSGKK